MGNMLFDSCSMCVNRNRWILGLSGNEREHIAAFTEHTKSSDSSAVWGIARLLCNQSNRCIPVLFGNLGCALPDVQNRRSQGSLWTRVKYLILFFHTQNNPILVLFANSKLWFVKRSLSPNRWILGLVGNQRRTLSWVLYQSQID